MQKRCALLVVLACAAALLGVSGCTDQRRPLPGVARVTAVVCCGVAPRHLADTAMPALKQLASRGAVALIARPARESTPLVDVLAQTAADVREAGDAAADPRGADAAIAKAAEAVGDGAVIVVSEPTESSYGLIVVAGAGVPHGLLESPRTRRPGVIAVEDVSDVVGSLSGGAQDATAYAVEALDGRAVERLVRAAAGFEAMRAAQTPLIVGFSALAGSSVLGLWALAEGERVRRRGYWRLAAGRALLLALCMPPATLLVRVLDPYPVSAARALVLVLGASGALWIGVETVSERYGLVAGLGTIGALTTVVLAADQLAGAPLAPGTAFSYSPLDGFRFYGIGNEGAAILVGSWLAALASVRPVVRDRWWLRLAASTGVLVIAVSSLPVLGANSMVAAWGTVAAGTFLAESVRGRVGFREALGAAAAAAAAVALVVAVERLTGAGTHISGAFTGAGGDLATVVVQRSAAVARAYAAHPAALVGFLAWAALLWARVRPPSALSRAMSARPAVRAASTAALAGGLIAGIAEDSSVTVMVLLALYAGATVAAATVDSERGGE